MSKKKTFLKPLLVTTILGIGLFGFSNKTFAFDTECHYTETASGGIGGGEVRGDQTATITGGISADISFDYIKDEKGNVVSTVVTSGGKTIVSCEGNCVTVETMKGTIIVNEKYAKIYEESETPGEGGTKNTTYTEPIDETIKEETKKFVPTGTANYSGGPGTGIKVKKTGTSWSDPGDTSSSWACVPVSVETEVTWYYQTQQDVTKSKSSNGSATVVAKDEPKTYNGQTVTSATKGKAVAGGKYEWSITYSYTESYTETVTSDVYKDTFTVDSTNQLAANSVSTHYGRVNLSELAKVTELDYNDKDHPEILSVDTDGNPIKGNVENAIKTWVGQKQGEAMDAATSGYSATRQVYVGYADESSSTNTSAGSSGGTIGFGGNGGQAQWNNTSVVFDDQEDCYNTANKDIIIATEVRLNNKYEELVSSSATFDSGCWKYSKNNTKPDGAYNYTSLASYRTKALSDIYVAKGISNPSHGFVWSIDDAYNAITASWITGRIITSSDIAPAAVEFHTHLIGGKYTGNTTDKLIYRDNVTGDAYINNLTNPNAMIKGQNYYKNPVYIPISNANAGVTKFNAILADSQPNTTDANGTTHKKFVWTSNGRANAAIEQADGFKMSSKENEQQGISVATMQLYIDQYYQRLFEVEEYSGLFMTISSTRSKATTSYADMFGKDQFVYFGNSTGACSKKMLGLTAEYGSGSLEQMYDNGGGNVAVAKNVTVRSLVNANGGVNAAISDIIAKRKAISNTGYHNQGFLIGSENVTIKFNDGTTTYSYSTYPSGLKIYETSSSGPSISVSSGMTSETGVYIEVQEKIQEGIVNEYDLYPTYNSWDGDEWEYTICIGEYHCTCADINVLCDCTDEEMGCPPICEGDDCSDNPKTTPTPTGTNNDHTYNCLDYNPATATAEEKEYCECYESGKVCDGTSWQDGHDCNDPSTTNVVDCNRNYPGGKTGGGSQDYYDKLYDTNSSLTN